jgi:hypothetical protein
VPDWERGVFRAVNDLPGFLYGPVWVVMQFGSWLAIVCVAGVALAVRRVRLAIAFALFGASANVLSSVFKAIVGRGRPAALLSAVHLRGAVPSGNGYPSGHASVAFALATVGWLWLDGWVRWVLPCAAVIVCFARMYVGAHFPSTSSAGPPWAPRAPPPSAWLCACVHQRQADQRPRPAWRASAAAATNSPVWATLGGKVYGWA